jgi:hypothetical protein
VPSNQAAKSAVRASTSARARRLIP